MIIDGNSVWGADTQAGMIQKVIAGFKAIDTFPGLPDNLYEALENSAARWPDKTEIVDNYGKEYTYQQFLAYSEEFAAYLNGEKNIRPGSHVGILMYNCAEFCIAFLALSRLGAVAVPLPSKFKKAEVLPLAERAQVEAVICDEDYVEWFCGTYDRETVIEVCGVGLQYGFNRALCGWQDKLGDMENLKKIPKGRPEDTAIIMFTSGTTSKSKGVLLKNYNIMHAVEAYRRTLHINEKDISVIATPIYHITGLVALLGLFLYAGGTLYIHKFFDAQRVIADARRFGFTFIHASPTVFNLIIQEGERTPPIDSLVSFACGSSNMMKDKLLRLHKWLPKSKFHTVYGLTETTSPATVFPGDAACSRFIGASGIPIPGTKFKIVDDDRNELPWGEVGEIAVRGAVVLDSYYKQEADSLTDGWLYTGDLGYFNEENYLYVVDRKKNMINRGGEKIWCYDVENEIASIEGVQDTAVVGIPDDLYGEVAAAVVQLEKGSALTSAEIQEYLRTRMAKYKVPVQIKRVDCVPQTPNGKTDKIAIKKILMEEE